MALTVVEGVESFATLLTHKVTPTVQLLMPGQCLLAVKGLGAEVALVLLVVDQQLVATEIPVESCFVVALVTLVDLRSNLLTFDNVIPL